jgi:K+-transporting ATPase KdpF subunit
MVLSSAPAGRNARVRRQPPSSQVASLREVVPCDKKGAGEAVVVLEWIIAVLTFAVLAYLVYALIHPERF